MIKPGLILTSLILFLPLISCTGEGESTSVQEQNLLEERQQEFFDAVSDKDLDKTVAMFSENALVHVAGMAPVNGQTAIRQLYSNMFGFITASDATPGTVHVSQSGDMAYSSGATSNRFSGPQGEVEYTGKYLLAWEKFDEEWLIAAYSISSNE